MRVGFIGLGDQGGPMARRVAEDGYPLTVWARRSETVERFADTGAAVAASPAEVGAASELVGVCVVADADVEQVLLGPDGVLAGMAPGGVVAVHSTVHPATCRRLAEQAAGGGIALVDAPVSGGGVAASERHLLVMVGGDDDPVARCRPVFATFGDPVIHLGGLGSGQLAKLVNNLLFMSHLAMGSHAFSLADGLGLDRAALADVLAHGSGGSSAVAVLAQMGYNAWGAERAGPVLRKDLEIVLDVAAGAGAPTGILVEAADTTLAIMGHPR